MEFHYDEIKQNQNVLWGLAESEVLVSPFLPKEEAQVYFDLAKQFHLPGHLWICSSGSSKSAQDSLKLIALKKEAFLLAAQGSNLHLQVSSKDIWLRALPRFHVGGLAIEARAMLAGNRVVETAGLTKTWNVNQFLQILKDESVTLTSLVPTQVYDLVQAKAHCPSSLRAVVIGGALLTEELYNQARDLGWPLLPSYGMTEACSQVATASLKSLTAARHTYPFLMALPHVQIKISDLGTLAVRSAALMTGYAQQINGKSNWFTGLECGFDASGWYHSQDLAELSEEGLKIFGRKSDFVKILGEGVSLTKVKEKFEKHLKRQGLNPFESVVFDIEDPRQGRCLVACTALVEKEKVRLAVENYNADSLAFERVREVRSIESLPKSSLGKIQIENLRQRFFELSHL